MFGFLKNLRSERSENPVSTPEPKEAPAALATAAPAAAPAFRSQGGHGRAPERILLPLQAITNAFPEALQSVIAQPPAASVAIALPVDEILDQLAGGRVEIALGQLRQVAPANTFIPDVSRDQERVALPLPELLSRLDPALLKPRGQRKVELPTDIESPFLQQNAPAPVAATAKGNAPASTPAPAPTPTPASVPRESEKEKLKQSGIVQASSEIQALFAGIRKNPAPAAPSPTPPPTILKPPRPAPEPKPAAAPAPPPVPKPAAKPIQIMAAQPATKPATATPARRQPIVDAPAIKLREAPPTAFPSSGAVAAPRPAAAPKGMLALPLAKIGAEWPEAIREEIAGAPPEAKIEFPADELGAALRQGKITVPWQRLRTMIVPKLPGRGESLYAEALLELPLSVVAPLFMASPGAKDAPAPPAPPPAPSSPPPVAKPEPPKAAPAPAPAPATPPQPPAPPAKAKPVEAAETPAPAAPAPARAPNPAPPPAPVSAPPPAPASPQPGALGLDDRIPSELVARACALNGVAGAVVALRDGLLVAATVPEEFKAETIAAFLPLVFSRLEQAAGTMQIGELQTLMFTAGNRPWQIWRAGSLFFAAVGRSNELLPGAQLKIIASQLARQIKL